MTEASNLAKQEDRWTCWTHKDSHKDSHAYTILAYQSVQQSISKSFLSFRSPQEFDTKLEHANTDTLGTCRLNLLNEPICELLRNKSGAGDTSRVMFLSPTPPVSFTPGRGKEEEEKEAQRFVICAALCPSRCSFPLRLTLFIWVPHTPHPPHCSHHSNPGCLARSVWHAGAHITRCTSHGHTLLE